MHTLLFLLVVIVGVMLFLAARRPDDFRITRTATMSAPAAAVFAQVNDFHRWEAWSPWAKLDPAAKSSFEGAASGTGAILRWAGNKKVGEGSMTILESRPDSFIKIRLEFLKPFKATNTAEFTFKSESGQTVVAWSTYGKNNFMAKLMGLVMNCEKMVGGQFEKGLTQMKTIVESANSK